MKILLINNLYPPYTRGGAERVVETIAHGLEKAGHVVRVVTTVSAFRTNIQAFFRGGWIRDVVQGVPVYRIATANLFPYWTIGNHNVVLRLFWHLFDMLAFETAAIVKRIVRIEKPDVVMTHNLMGIGFLIPRALRSLRVRHVHTVHDVQLSVPSGLLFFGQRIPFLLMIALSWYERFVRFLIGSPHVVIAPSQWLLDFYTERGFFLKSKKIVLGNPISSPVIARPIENRPKQSHALSILYVGQIEQHKGILFLIKTLQLTTENLQLDIVGDGALLEKIKKIAAEDQRISIHGRIDSERIGEFYARADVVIVPSLVYENAPTVILEAFAHGVPVIASRVGGIPELVRDHETGWTFEAGNQQELLGLLQKVCSDQKALQTMGKNARTFIAAHTIENYIQRFLKM